MKSSDPATIALAAVAILGLLAGVIGWLYKRGAYEHQREANEAVMAQALTDNTEATKELSRDLRSFRESTIEAVTELKGGVTELRGRVGALEAWRNN